MHNQLTLLGQTQQLVGSQQQIETLNNQNQNSINRLTDQMAQINLQLQPLNDELHNRQAELEQSQSQASIPLAQREVTFEISDETRADSKKLYMIANEFFLGTNNRQQNYPHALFFYQHAADAENFQQPAGAIVVPRDISCVAQAIYMLGHMHIHGLGTAHNIEEGKKWCKKALDKGYLAALPELWRVSSGDEQLLYRVRMAFDNVAVPEGCTPLNLNDPEELYQQQKPLHRDDSTREYANKCLARAAELGHGEAAYALGNRHMHGFAKPSGAIAALPYFMKAVQLNAPQKAPVDYFLEALTTPQELHSYGDQLAGNYPEAAFACYKKANDAAAWKKMALFYSQGKGVAKDIQASFNAYCTALQKGATVSPAEITALTEDANTLNNFGGSTYSSYPAIGFACYQKAANKGDGAGLYNLAWMYEYGYGCTKDTSTALYYYQQSANKSYSGASTAVTRLAPPPAPARTSASSYSTSSASTTKTLVAPGGTWIRGVKGSAGMEITLQDDQTGEIITFKWI